MLAMKPWIISSNKPKQRETQKNHHAGMGQTSCILFRLYSWHSFSFSFFFHVDFVVNFCRWILCQISPCPGGRKKGRLNWNAFLRFCLLFFLLGFWIYLYTTNLLNVIYIFNQRFVGDFFSFFFLCISHFTMNFLIFIIFNMSI